MTTRKGPGVLAAIGAGAATMAGAAALKWYLWDVVVGQMGASDRSMVFWGLPVALMGVGALAVAALLAWAARRMLQSPGD